jgi:hypothetical protein
MGAQARHTLLYSTAVVDEFDDPVPYNPAQSR